MSAEASRKLRCAIYTRKSSEEGLEQAFNSLDAQREACAAFILSQRHEGWTEIPTHYDDGGYSGGSMNRPALTALMRDIDDGSIDSVVVYKVDRLTRALSDFAKIVDCFDAKKVSFVSVTQQFNTTTSMGRLTLNVLLSFAQFEREVTGERIRDKIAASKKKGMWMGGLIPMGYDLDGRKLVVNEAEAEAVRSIYRRYLDTGCVAALKAQLDADQIISKTRVSRTGKRSGGVPYSRGALYQLLQNRLYIGETNHKQRTYPGEHVGIVDAQLWEAVQARLLANTQGHRSGARSQTPSLLVGKLFTSDGDRLIPSHTIKGSKRYRYYVTAPGGKQKVRVPANDLEKDVLRRLTEFLASGREVVDLLAPSEGARRQEDLVNAAAGVVGEGGAKAEILIDVIDRIVVGRQDYRIHCSVESLLRLLLDEEAEGRAGDQSIELVSTPDRVSARQVRLVFLPREDGAVKLGTPKTSLIKAAARARSWYEQLISGDGVTLASLGATSSVNASYTSRILRCAFLAPDVVEGLLDGRVSDEGTLARLLRDLPRSWKDQRQMLTTCTAWAVT